VRYSRNDISFAAINMPGSNNSIASVDRPGLHVTDAGAGAGGEQPDRADIELIHDTFAQAKADRNRSVVLQTQADMFDPTVASPQFSDYSAFKPIVQTIIDEASAFDGPVYLFNGDSHVLQPGSSVGERIFLAFVLRGDGDSGQPDPDHRQRLGLGEIGWLRVTTHSVGQPLTWQQIPAS
jgi:hypothetical protein